MPQTVDIEGIGSAEFPDEMTPDEIKGVIKKKYFARPTPTPEPTPPPQPRVEEIRASQPSDRPAQILATLGRAADALFSPGEESQHPIISPEVAEFGTRLAAGPARLVASGLEKVTGKPFLQAEQGIEKAISGAASGFSLETLAALPAFALPGVAETYAAGVIAKLPEQYGRVKDVIQEHGLFSQETGKVLGEAGIEDVMGLLAGKGGPPARGFVREAIKPRITRPPLSETLAPVIGTTEALAKPITAPGTMSERLEPVIGKTEVEPIVEPEPRIETPADVLPATEATANEVLAGTREIPGAQYELPIKEAAKPTEEVIPSATQERQVTEGGQPEYQGDAEIRPSIEAVDSGRVEPTAPVGEEAITAAEPKPLSEPAQKVFDAAKATEDEFKAIDATDLEPADRRALAEKGLSFTTDRENRVMATYPARMRAEDLRRAVTEKRAAAEAQPLTYEEVSKATTEATKEFTAVQDQYRAGNIGDEEFLAAKAKHDAAQAEFDKAFAAERDKPPATAGVPVLRAESNLERLRRAKGSLSESGKRKLAALEAKELPTLRPGETQGDLLSKQTEDLALVGEKGTDFEARQADMTAAEVAKEEARLKAEHEQGLLEEFQQHQAAGGDELLDAIKSGGGLPALASERSGIFKGELQNIREAYQAPRGEKIKYADIFRKDAPDIDVLTQHLKDRGFDVETPADTVTLIEKRIANGKPIYGSEARGQAIAEGGMEHDWTGATTPIKFKGGGESGAINLGVVKDITKSFDPKMSQLDQATGERSARLQQSFADAKRAQTEIKKAAPTEQRQSAISIWMEAKGDAATLAQWATAAKGKVFKQAAIDAQTLSPAEIAIAQKTGQAFSVLEKRGNTYDVLGNHRENYVPHVWDVSKRGTGIGSSKLQDRFKFNKARTFANFFEGDQAGFKPKTLAIGKLLPTYLSEMNRVIADRQFIQSVADKTSKEGDPLLIPRGRVREIETDSGGKATLVDPRAVQAKSEALKKVDQSKYKVLGDQPALRDWRWEGKDAEGNPIYMKDDLAVHPELAKRLNATMGQSAIRAWYNEPSTGLSVVPKAIAKGLDVAQSVMKREMFGLLAPFHQVQEGTHGIGHLVNPTFGIPDMTRPTPAHVDAMKHGLMIMPDRTVGAQYMEGLGGKGTFLSQLAGKIAESKFGQSKIGKEVIGNEAKMIRDTVDGYQDYLFHQYIPGLKFKTYEHIQERNMGRYKNDIAKGELTESDVKLLSAEQANAAYGHLNYALLDRNPTMQHILQLGLLAPDFLEARARFVGQAAKSLVGSKAGHEQFRAIATLAAVQAGTAYTLSKLAGSDWDWKHPFEVTIGNRRYFLRSVPEDLHRLFFQGHEVRRQFVSARVNPLAARVDELRTGLNYRGEKVGPLDTMTELLATYIPLTARSIPGIRDLTKTSRNNPVSPLEQLAGSLGLKISRYSPISKVHEIANKWMDKQGISRTEGAYPISKYQKLRYALEDADLDRAKGEWKTLLTETPDASKLSRGFTQSINHPFTMSNDQDKTFRATLKGGDRLLFDHAMEVRQGILHKFQAITGGTTATKSKSRKALGY